MERFSVVYIVTIIEQQLAKQLKYDKKYETDLIKKIGVGIHRHLNTQIL